MANGMIVVDVVSASAGALIRHRVMLPVGSTVNQAIEASGIANMLGDGATAPHRIGIFSRRVHPQDVLQDGDRVEIYRPLQLDPMEARRRRARKVSA